MSSDGGLVSLATAQGVFDSLPAELQIPTLSPRYVAADARRDPLLIPLFFVWQQASALLLHSFHEARVPGRDENDWQSAYGYGGAIRVGPDELTAGKGWPALDQLALARSVVAEFIRFHPVIANQVGYPGTVRPDRAVVQIDLTVRDLISSYGGRARTTVRKALNRGLAPSWLASERAKELFPDFYREGMRQIGATDFYLFSDDYFAELLQLPGARVLMISQEGEPVSMGLFLFGPRTVEYHLSATTRAGRDAGATSLLLHVAAHLAQGIGCTGLFLGGGTDARPDNPLLLFKRSFAAPTLHFHIGYRIHLGGAYAQIQAAHPDLAATGRVLFYRR